MIAVVFAPVETFRSDDIVVHLVVIVMIIIIIIIIIHGSNIALV